MNDVVWGEQAHSTVRTGPKEHARNRAKNMQVRAYIHSNYYCVIVTFLLAHANSNAGGSVLIRVQRWMSVLINK